MKYRLGRVEEEDILELLGLAEEALDLEEGRESFRLGDKGERTGIFIFSREDNLKEYIEKALKRYKEEKFSIEEVEEEKYRGQGVELDIELEQEVVRGILREVIEVDRERVDKYLEKNCLHYRGGPNIDPFKWIFM